MIVCISHAKVGHPQAKLLKLENLSESWGFLVYTHMVVDRLNLITLRDVNMHKKTLIIYQGSYLFVQRCG